MRPYKVQPGQPANDNREPTEADGMAAFEMGEFDASNDCLGQTFNSPYLQESYWNGARQWARINGRGPYTDFEWVKAGWAEGSEEADRSIKGTSEARFDDKHPNEPATNSPFWMDWNKGYGSGWTHTQEGWEDRMAAWQAEDSYEGEDAR